MTISDGFSDYSVMLYDFPDYPAADLPPLPPGWEHSTFRHDACPSYMFKGLQVFIDYADPAKRETTHYNVVECRFHVFDVESFNYIIAKDNWQEVVDAVHAYAARES
jgi:hypothetical protein